MTTIAITGARGRLVHQIIGAHTAINISAPVKTGEDRKTLHRYVISAAAGPAKPLEQQMRELAAPMGWATVI